MTLVYGGEYRNRTGVHGFAIRCSAKVGTFAALSIHIGNRTSDYKGALLEKTQIEPMNDLCFVKSVSFVSYGQSITYCFQYVSLSRPRYQLPLLYSSINSLI